MRIGYFGSYARGDWGVGSDLDLVVLVDPLDRPFAKRAVDWDLSTLPVPADMLVYTPAEWEASTLRRFRATVEREGVWVYSR